MDVPAQSLTRGNAGASCLAPCCKVILVTLTVEWFNNPPSLKNNQQPLAVIVHKVFWLEVELERPLSRRTTGVLRLRLEKLQGVLVALDVHRPECFEHEEWYGNVLRLRLRR